MVSEGGRRALDEQGHRDQQQAAGDQLPAGGGQQRGRGGPALAEHHAGGHHGGAAQGRRHADGVQLGVRPQDQQGDAGDADHGGEQGAQGEALAEQSGGEAGHQQWLHGADGGGDAAGQAVGRDEQQGQEEADVQGAEHHRLPPPTALRQLPGDGDQQEAGG
ncbi:hypothetical protein [Kitasatospora sp. NPDC004289]